LKKIKGLAGITILFHVIPARLRERMHFELQWSVGAREGITIVKDMSVDSVVLFVDDSSMPARIHGLFKILNF